MKTRILIVDDEKPLAEMLGMIFSMAGYQCQVALSGAEALDCVRIFNPALMISDVMMPGMNGIELTKLVLDSYPGCAVLLFTASAATLDLSEITCRERAFLRVLAKPAHPQELLTTVAQMLEIRLAHERQFPTALLKDDLKKADAIRQRQLRFQAMEQRCA
jgi:CheY-like chemotaxis protein